MTSLISFPPSFLLIQLFRRSKSRVPRNQMFKEKLDEIKGAKNLTDLNNMEEKIPTENKKLKKKNKLEFPWWCKIIAYTLSVIFTGVALFFIITKGIAFGDEKVSKWLGSFISGIFSSILITQPIQVALTTALLVLLFRKTENFTNFDDADINLKYVEENQIDCDKKMFAYYKSQDTQDPKNMREVKIKFLKEKKAMAILREIFVYSIFLFVLFLVSFTNKDLNSFMYQKQVQRMFNLKSLENVLQIDDIWEWTKKSFVPAFKNDKELKNFMLDKTSFIIGKPMIRQLRIKNGKIKKITFYYHKFLAKKNEDILSYEFSDLKNFLIFKS